MTHTPGPWEYAGFHFEDWKILSGNLQRTVAIIPNEGDSTTYIHNARLITAAPDMLEALEAMFDQPHMASTLARAAIAKAKGLDLT